MIRGLLGIFLTAYIIASAGCAHSHSVIGDEPKSEIPEGVRVTIGGTEVKEGEKVSVFRSVCTNVPRRRGGEGKSCSPMKVGEALVLKVLDDDSAIVQPDAGVAMDTEMFVEKK